MQQKFPHLFKFIVKKICQAISNEKEAFCLPLVIIYEQQHIVKVR